MSRITGSFDAYDMSSTTVFVPKGNRASFTLFGTFVANITIQAKPQDGAWTTLQTLTSPGTTTLVPVETPTHYRLNISGDVDEEETAIDFTSGEAFYVIEEAIPTPETARVWDDLRFPAQSINPTGLTGAADVDDTQTDFPGTLLFDKTTSQLCCGVAQMPHTWVVGSPIRPHIHWAKSAIGAGGVVWHLYTRRTDPGSVAGSWVGPMVGINSLATGDAAHTQGITTFGDVDMSGGVNSSMIAWRLYRMPDETADDYANDARLFEFDIHYLKGSEGTALEFKS